MSRASMLKEGWCAGRDCRRQVSRVPLLVLLVLMAGNSLGAQLCHAQEIEFDAVSSVKVGSVPGLVDRACKSRVVYSMHTCAHGTYLSAGEACRSATCTRDCVVCRDEKTELGLPCTPGRTSLTYSSTYIH
jgi:hypothetical protein